MTSQKFQLTGNYLREETEEIVGNWPFSEEGADLEETLRPFRKKKVDSESMRDEYEAFYKNIGKSRDKKKRKIAPRYIKPIPRKTYEKLKVFFLGLFLRYLEIQKDLQKKLEIERGTLSYKRDELGVKIAPKRDDGDPDRQGGACL